jgi:hypothetical protein
MIMGGFPVLFGVFCLLVLIGVATGFTFLALASLKETTASLKSQGTLLTQNNSTTRLLAESDPQALPSVTERTTESLTINRND